MKHIRTFCSSLVVFAMAVATSLGQDTPPTVTFIHNSPDPTIRTVDLRISQVGTDMNDVQDITFQNGTDNNSILFYAGLELTLEVWSDGGGQMVSSLKFTPADNHTYVVVMDGLNDTTGYVNNPDGRSKKLKLTVLDPPVLSSDPLKTGVIFHHGSPDLEKADAVIKATSPIVLAQAIAYGDDTKVAVNVERTLQTINLTKAGDRAKILGAFSANFGQLGNEVLLMIISGFMSPADNKGSTDSLALIAVTNAGSIVRIPLMVGSQTARIQWIHGASAKALGIMDVLKDGVKAIDNFAYRTAQPFIDESAGLSYQIGIGLSTTATIRDTLFTRRLDALNAGRKYLVVAGGSVALDTNFAKNPDGRSTRFALHVFSNALETSEDAASASVRTVHMATDAPEIIVRSKNGKNYAEGLMYGDATETYTTAEAMTDTLVVAMRNIWQDGAPDSLWKNTGYIATFAAGKAYVLLATGFLDPAANQGAAQQGFQLSLIEAGGKATTLPTTILNQTQVSVPMDDDASLTVGPNPTDGTMTLNWANAPVGATVTVTDLMGRTVHSAIIDGGSSTLDLSGAATGMYVLTVSDASGRPVAGRMITRR